ncbi:hypothetical protein ABXN37_08780 [Piscinibacter sakaiensis]|uniref:hypothetical protein n=1 Tax=Piscinibacter sakaiensis TaxID=1547922 RepID=UPI003727AFB3
MLDHLGGYAELVAVLSRDALESLRRRTLLATLLVVCLLLALTLTGVALLLVAALPPASMHAPWLLVAVPALPWLGALVAGLGLRQAPRQRPFDAVREQIDADVALLRRAADA